MLKNNQPGLSRRQFLRTGGAGLAGIAGLFGLRGAASRQADLGEAIAQDENGHAAAHAGAGAVGSVDYEANGFSPHEILTDFDYGVVSEEDGRPVRTWNMVAVDLEFLDADVKADLLGKTESVPQRIDVE